MLVLVGFMNFVGSHSEPQVTVTDLQAQVISASYIEPTDVDYEVINDRLAELRKQLTQPNVVREDILRGWYLALESEKRYGTPDTWVFVEDGSRSRWTSPLALEAAALSQATDLCQQTAGHYVVSCLDSADVNCEYVSESFCQCPLKTRWHQQQGCIQVTERDSFVAITAEDLEKGWYFGRQSEKKLNTPSDWSWSVAGKNQLWKRNN